MNIWPGVWVMQSSGTWLAIGFLFFSVNAIPGRLVLSGHQPINSQITQKTGHSGRTDFFFGRSNKTF
jgi:hypothetical protein